jgi:glutamyl-tRNA synthetase
LSARAPAPDRSPARGRFAPSPTGRLHLGNARTALLAWLAARQHGGGFVLRVEDLDRDRVVAGAETALLRDLAWLGIDWDEGPDRGGGAGPYRQSERSARYDAAIDRLRVAGRVFPCACSRTELARAASAPHGADDEGPRYPGTCRGRPVHEVEARARELGRSPALRFDGRSERIEFHDWLQGTVEPMGDSGIDDFVLRRADGVAAYQLAVVVDDAAMAIDEVVRGADLLRSTPRQIALYRALGAERPQFAHVPLLLTPGGDRMAKRTRPPSIETLRADGADPRAVVGRLAASAGLCERRAELTPIELLAHIAGTSLWSRLNRLPTVWQ